MIALDEVKFKAAGHFASESLGDHAATSFIWRRKRKSLVAEQSKREKLLAEISGLMGETYTGKNAKVIRRKWRNVKSA